MTDPLYDHSHEYPHASVLLPRQRAMAAGDLWLTVTGRVALALAALALLMLMCW